AQVRHLGLQGQRERELVLVDQLEPDEDLADEAPLLALLAERALDRVGRDVAAADQDLAEPRRHRPDRRGRGRVGDGAARQVEERGARGRHGYLLSLFAGALSGASMVGPPYSIGPSITFCRVPRLRRTSVSFSTDRIERLISSIRPRLR